MYRENTERIHPNITHRYDAAPEASMEGLASQIEDDLHSQIRHEPIGVPDHRNVFDDETEALFFSTLQEIVEANVMPAGYGLFPDEWEEDRYPLFETLKVGKRGSKSIVISLAAPIWRQRAVLWAQAVNLPTRFIE
jgi:hypothetical protein